MYDLNILLERISKLCETNSLSINQMLKLASLSPSVVDNIKRGRIPSIDKIQTIATFFDCSIDYIVGRTEEPTLNSKAVSLPLLKTEELNKPTTKTIIIPFYRIPTSAGTGSWLFDETPVEYTNVPKTDQTSSADFMLEVRGDSMQPKFSDGDRVLVKCSESIYEGEIGVFILNNESYIKKMGRNELISLNPAYNPIKLTEYDDIRCAGKVLGTLDIQ